MYKWQDKEVKCENEGILKSERSILESSGGNTSNEKAKRSSSQKV